MLILHMLILHCTSWHFTCTVDPSYREFWSKAQDVLFTYVGLNEYIYYCPMCSLLEIKNLKHFAVTNCWLQYGSIWPGYTETWNGFTVVRTCTYYYYIEVSIHIKFTIILPLLPIIFTIYVKYYTGPIFTANRTYGA